MINRHYWITVLFFCFSLLADGQNRGNGISTLSTLISNPGMVGVEGDATIRLSYRNIYPGNGYNLQYLQLSFDGFLESMHGGVSAFLTSDRRTKMVNDINGGVAYSYHFRAGENIYVSAGLSASVYYRGYNYSNALLPDQISQVGTVSGSSQEVFDNLSVVMPDLSTGILLMTGNLYGGVSVSHLTSPDMSGSSSDGIGELYRTLLVHGGGVVNLSATKEYILKPQAAFEVNRNVYQASVGMSIENNFLSLSTFFLHDKFNNIDLLAGAGLSIGDVRFMYNYCFNILSYNRLLPSTIHHQAGIAIGLYSVNKRKMIKSLQFSKI